MRSSQKVLKVLPNSAPEASQNGILLPSLNTGQWDGSYSNQLRKPFSDDEEFKKINKKRQDLVVDRAANFGLTSTDPVVRANQLEQNIRFLQEQHQIMLAGLHGEIETLRQRNRDLQFQMVFSKGGVALLQNSPSPDDDSQRKIVISPNQMNITPLQVEILERDLAELRTNLSEARTRNVYLQNVVDDQKKKLAALENEKLDLAAVGKKIGKENVAKATKSTGREESGEDLAEKLEDADRLIRRLRRENEEQRKEIVSLRTTVSKQLEEKRKSEGGNIHRNYYRNSQSQTSRFPPLHPHPNWKNSSDYQQNRNPDRGGNRLDRDSEVVGRPAPTLPHLRDRNNASTSTGYSNPAYNHYQSGNHKRNYHYHRKQDDHRGNNRGPRREQLYQPDNE